MNKSFLNMLLYILKNASSVGIFRKEMIQYEYKN
jgi:hypothetical protein